MSTWTAWWCRAVTVYSVLGGLYGLYQCSSPSFVLTGRNVAAVIAGMAVFTGGPVAVRRILAPRPVPERVMVMPALPLPPEVPAATECAGGCYGSTGACAPPPVFPLKNQRPGIRPGCDIERNEVACFQ